MSWMDANEYLAIEQAVRDRVDEVERFSTEQAFRSETDVEEAPPGAVPPPARRAGCPSGVLATVRCMTVRPPQAA
jgi:hypothetical protein